MLSDLVSHRPRYAAPISLAILSINHLGVVTSAQCRQYLATIAPTPPRSAFRHADWQCRLHDAMWPLTVLVLTLPLVTGEAHDDWPAWEWRLAWAQHLQRAQAAEASLPAGVLQVASLALVRVSNPNPNHNPNPNTILTLP